MSLGLLVFPKKESPEGRNKRMISDYIKKDRGGAPETDESWRAAAVPAPGRLERKRRRVCH
jgi:hypothetical protein